MNRYGVVLAWVTLSIGFGVQPARAHPGVDGPEHQDGLSASQVSQQLSNPVSNIWSIQYSSNWTLFRGFPSTGNVRGSYTGLLQPVMPLHLTEDWNLIVRPVIPIQNVPYLDRRGSWERTTAFGQANLSLSLSPAKLSSGLLWGAGPTFSIPLGTNDHTTQGKYAMGPGAVGLYLSKDWVFGVFPQYWWSFSGSSKFSAISQANIQYFIFRALGDGWQVGMSPNITYDHMADSGNHWNVPVGLGATKVFRLGKLPIKVQGEVQYSAIKQADFGTVWNFKLNVTPVIPALIKRNLLEF